VEDTSKTDERPTNIIRSKRIVILASLLIVVTGLVLYTTVIKDDKPKTCTTYGNRVEKQCIEDYIGLTQDEAIERAKQYNYYPMIASVDGEPKGGIDIGGSLIFFEIEKGRVVGGYFEPKEK